MPHEVLEQELETLTSVGQEQGEDEVRKRMRVIKNRLSAKKSREQARDYVQKLESSLSALMAEHQSLARRLAMVEYENATLRHQMYFAQPPTPPQSHVDQPAVLSNSPQLDAALVLVWATMVMCIGLVPFLATISRGNKALVQPSQASPARLSAPGPGPWARRSRHWLRRAGLLSCIEHACRSIPLPPLPVRHLAASAAA